MGENERNTHEKRKNIKITEDVRFANKERSGYYKINR